jgi:hypothetical protein
MKQHFIMLVLASTAMSGLSGCAGPRVAGNEIGGAIPMSGISRNQAADLAKAHCSKYGRSSRMLSVRTEEGEKAVFECI